MQRPARGVGAVRFLARSWPRHRRCEPIVARRSKSKFEIESASRTGLYLFTLAELPQHREGAERASRPFADDSSQPSSIAMFRPPTLHILVDIPKITQPIV